MLRQLILCQSKTINTQQKTLDPTAIQQSLLLDIINENHYMYPMETRERPNQTIRLLVELHRLGATQEQLSLAYQTSLLTTEPIRISDTHKVNQTNWQDFLGMPSYYGDYLIFFDHQLSKWGLQQTLTRYFYSLSPSMGAQLQPLVHLAFGIQHQLPQIQSEALAYYASAYLDVSHILLEDYDQPIPSDTPMDSLDHLLYDLLRVDQRFDGRFEDTSFRSAIKLLLKSKPDLIKTYMKTWSTHYTQQSRLDALLYTATRLYQVGKRTKVDLDGFLATGHLIEATLAIQTCIRPEHLEDWIHLQFLNIVCTFVVQGRPNLMSCPWVCDDIETCVTSILNTADMDPKLVLALASLLKVNQHYPDWSTVCLESANRLVCFLEEGSWVKNSLGWI